MVGSHNVLVIDDDETVLVSIADLLEDDGFHVFTQGSPIGASQVIAREAIDVAVIDVNLPVMQGDKVARLLQSWDRVQELAVVIISGAEREKLALIEKGLPGVSVVPKAHLRRDLTTAIRAALGSRGARSAGRAGTAKDRQGAELVARFTEQLAESMVSLGDWRSLATGSRVSREVVASELATLQGRAQLLDLERAGQLIGSLADALAALRANRPPSLHAQGNIDSAIAALTRLKRSANGEFALSPEPLLRGLEYVLDEMRGA